MLLRQYRIVSSHNNLRAHGKAVRKMLAEWEFHARFREKEKKENDKISRSLSLFLSLRDISNLNIALIIAVSEDRKKVRKFSLSLSFCLDRIRCNIEILKSWLFQQETEADVKYHYGSCLITRTILPAPNSQWTRTPDKIRGRKVGG